MQGHNPLPRELIENGGGRFPRRTDIAGDSDETGILMSLSSVVCMPGQFPEGLKKAFANRALAEMLHPVLEHGSFPDDPLRQRPPVLRVRLPELKERRHGNRENFYVGKRRRG
jgi:hypothetical protein